MLYIALSLPVLNLVGSIEKQLIRKHVATQSKTMIPRSPSSRPTPCLLKISWVFYSFFSDFLGDLALIRRPITEKQESKKPVHVASCLI